ncbi:hypothetical protein ACIF83_24935 [Streptomyces sp. NPDC085866]|uniref:hypothetical protein n=1 Tax=Streptomyces sp. NPDC085866 TaxID=3365736 RepID=UPI0037CF59C6
MYSHYHADHLGGSSLSHNIYIHFPDHGTLTLVDINLPGWVPFQSFNLNEDVPSSIAARPRSWSTRGSTTSAATWAGSVPVTT